MRKISGIFLALLLVLLPLCLTGCMNAAELKERTIIKMVGVDMDGEEYLLTMLQFSPQAQSGEKTSESQSLVIQTKGRSIRGSGSGESLQWKQGLFWQQQFSGSGRKDRRTGTGRGAQLF